MGSFLLYTSHLSCWSFYFPSLCILLPLYLSAFSPPCSPDVHPLFSPFPPSPSLFLTLSIHFSLCPRLFSPLPHLFFCIPLQFPLHPFPFCPLSLHSPVPTFSSLPLSIPFYTFLIHSPFASLPPPLLYPPHSTPFSLPSFHPALHPLYRRRGKCYSSTYTMPSAIRQVVFPPWYIIPNYRTARGRRLPE